MGTFWIYTPIKTNLASNASNSVHARRFYNCMMKSLCNQNLKQALSSITCISLLNRLLFYSSFSFQQFCFIFSSCGNYLATQGETPDYLLTIWNWREETKLAAKPSPAYQHYQVAFAAEQHNKITTCGTPVIYRRCNI